MYYINKRTNPIFHVEKINNRSFKIYKDKIRNQHVNQLPIQDINFQIHVKRNHSSNHSERPRL
jgi:hypothetical protein